MNFQDAIQVCFSKYADFSGRARRPEYWWFALFVLLASAVMAVLSHRLLLLFSLATLLPHLAVTVRRLADTGRSAWWLLIYFVPVVGWLLLLFLLAQPSLSDVGSGSDTGAST